MTLRTLMDALPPEAADLAKSLDLVRRESLLTDQQKAGAFLVCAFALRAPRISLWLAEEFAATLSADALASVKTIASIMPVYNLYYRFAGLVGTEEYRDMPLKLRLSGLSKLTTAPLDNELWIVAVSALNGCGYCLQAHEPEAREHGASVAQIQAVVRIAALLYACAAVLESIPGENDHE
ncbi:MAG TPA: carboxymuconolactone decarboxylase family protein [Dongiaceae bacterium]|jgi:alkyl hydroperoxide reductase subunit D|nr:carboxymuconolactone decarboxylase family protein [Dongiaceae bacterium]